MDDPQPTTMDDTQQPTTIQNPRKRPRRDNAYQEAYKGVEFHAIPSSGRPGTPHCFFKESYRVQFTDQDQEHQDQHQNDNKDPENVAENSDDNDDNDNIRIPSTTSQIVHRHVNGLVIVTAGNALEPYITSLSPSSARNDDNIDSNDKKLSLEWLQTVAAVAGESAGRKRKLQAKMLKGKTHKTQRQQQQVPEPEPGIVRPTDLLVRVVTGQVDDQSMELRACVWGTLLERNEQPELPLLLREDPLLNGYLAVVLPTGPFPPPTNQRQSETSEEPPKEEEEVKEEVKEAAKA